MRTEAALGADHDSLQRLLPALSGALGDPACSLLHPPLHLLLALQLPQLGAHHTQNDILVLGKVLQGLEAAGARGVVLEVEGVDVEFLEKLLGDHVVGARGKVAAADEVAAAEVDTGVEVGGEEGEGVVVELDVGVEEGVDGDGVIGVGSVTGAELFGAEVWRTGGVSW